jgi:NAD(P)H-flavin reductase
MTEMGKFSLPLAGETGFINEDLVTIAGGDLPASIYYLDRPPAMVEAVRQTLKQSGVDGDDIRCEELYGY